MVYIIINTVRSKCGWAFVIWCMCYVNKIKGEEVKAVREDQN